MLDSARLVSEGYGQHRPIAPNDSEAGRARNRRVEMIISGKNMLDKLGDSIEQYHTLVKGEAQAPESSAPSSASQEESSTSHDAGLSNTEGQEG